MTLPEPGECSMQPMSYTFWHCGILIGESELEDASGNPGQRSGTFWPTAHGLQIFPRLTGILSAGYALKQYLDDKGLSEDHLSKDDIEELFETTPAGRKIIDIGRTLSQVELRAPNGTRLPFKSISFMDLTEIQAVAEQLDPVDERTDTPAADTPRYTVSMTLRDPSAATEPASSRERRLRH